MYLLYVHRFISCVGNLAGGEGARASTRFVPASRPWLPYSTLSANSVKQIFPS